MNATKKFLPMLGHTRGKRSPVTCSLKCDNACSKAVCNTSGNSYFRDIVSSQISRRATLGLGLAGVLGAAVVLTGCDSKAGGGTSGATASGKLEFTPIQAVDAAVDTFDVPEGYGWAPILRWGDPLLADAPDFDFAAQTPEAQAGQFGYNNDYLEILRQPNGKKGLLVCNHEYVNPAIMFPAKSAHKDEEAARRGIFRNAVGMSVVELERDKKGTPWSYVRGGKLNRRVTVGTKFELTGPVAGSDLVKTAADPEGRFVLGTLGNCAGGTTPWGTILSGEENFNGFFRTGGTSPEDLRYGLSDEETSMGWELDEPRFDARGTDYRNEPNRFGWIVEIDPEDPNSVPRKHSSMGRFKHEGANVIVSGSGKVVAYSGDDERFDYLYKFVSRNKYKEGDKAHNMTLLSEGDLYVARFTGNSEGEVDGSGKVPADGSFDGDGVWLPLVVGGKSVIAGMGVEQVLVYTRLAADIAGATKMDRCEDVEPSLKTGKVYVACTNNTKRGVDKGAKADEANPRTENRDGHVVEITEKDGDSTALSFNWNILLLCGDPAKNSTAYFSGFPAEKVSPISCPDNLAFDAAGNLWISTDGAPSVIGYNDGLFKVGLEGANRGNVQQFASVPREAETCGPLIHDDESMVYVAVQHPGEDGDYGAPHSMFPDYVAPGATPAPGQVSGARPSVVQIFAKSAT